MNRAVYESEMMNFRTFANIVLFSVLSVSAFAEGEPVDETKDAEVDGYVDISVVRGSVRLKGWDKASIRVVGTLDEETKAFIFEVDGDETNIKVKINDRDHGWFSSYEGADLTIYVPAASQIEFGGVSTDFDARGLTGSVEIGVVSGDTYLEGGTSRITVQTVSGEIELHGGTGRIRVNSVSGDVESYNTTGDARYYTVSGNIFIVDGGEDLSLESISGDIEVTAKLLKVIGGHSVSGDISVSGDAEIGSSIEFDSVSGDIRLLLGGEINARFDLETGSGSIRNRISDDESRSSKYMPDETLRFTIGDGEGQVTLSTHSGDISLGRR